MFTIVSASAHQLHAVLLRAFAAEPAEPAEPDRPGDRGAISLEQVLWFVAVAVSVGVVAAILWNRVFEAANDAQLDVPVAPGG